MRVNDMQKILGKKKIDIALLFNIDFCKSDENFLYFSGYEDIGFLVIPKKERPSILLPAMDYQRYKGRRFKKYKLMKKMKAFQQIKNLNIKRKLIGIDYGSISLKMIKALKKEFKGSKFADISGICDELRKSKTKEEIMKIRRACGVADEVIQKCISGIKSGRIKTEEEASQTLEIETIKRGCKLSFPPIVASGKMASIPHYKPQDVKFRKGFCVIDYGAQYHGYKSDITRTIYIGRPSAFDIELYETVRGCQERLVSEVAAGDKCKDIYLRSLDLLGKYKKKFIHGLGHGIGVKIHELPSLIELSEDRLVEGSVFTIEPGIYFKNKLGIRIEDDVAIVKGKSKVLTKTSKKLVIV